MYDDDRGRRTLKAWYYPHAIDAVCENIAAEADAMVKALSTHKSVSELTPAYLRAWSLKDTIAKPADVHAPDLLRILRCVLSTPKALAKNTKKSNETACYTILGQIVSRRSQQAPDFAAPMALMWWANGTSREAIEILCNIGLSKSFDTISKMLGSLGEYCIGDARELAHGPDGYLFNYDNINFSTSKFVEQRSDAPAKVQSGTYFIIYRLLNPNPAALDLPFLLLRAQNAPDLDFNRDLCPSLEQSQSAHRHFCSYVTRVLARYEKSFAQWQDHPALKAAPRRALPPDYTTTHFPLKICTTKESSIKGNLAVHVESHINQLRLTYSDLTKPAIRAFDVNPFLRCQIWQLAIGLFHLCLNLVWGVLNVHRGHVNHHGTLAHLFVLIEKTRLGSQHPDYHSLLAALMQILDGLILDAWRIECGYPSLVAYAASKPSAADLQAKAAQILYNHATPNRDPFNSAEELDTVNENTKRLIHDLLYVSEVTRAISECDFGRVEDILSTLGMMFRGAGSKNYSTEILYFVHNMKYVWSGNGYEYAS
ncbi:hypothetical protein C8R46DRAFT_915028 [Mycena filopes]|nr:hypothetical protein C8R46DRAFT_915028 [Mycena filopes]